MFAETVLQGTTGGSDCRSKKLISVGSYWKQLPVTWYTALSYFTEA